MKRIRRSFTSVSRLKLVPALAVAGLVIGGAASYAAIPDGQGVIHGCFATKGGAVRVIDEAASCKSTETPLNWNQTGPKGDPGRPATLQTRTKVVAIAA